jgi:tetratricopeptide (TPR) repeat protein
MSVPPPADTTSSPSIKRRSASVASVPDAEVEIIEDDALVSVPGAHSRGAFSGAGIPSVDLPSLDPDVTDPPDADFEDDAPDLVVLGDDAPRSQTEEADFEIDAIMQKAVSDAEAFRKLRLYSKAVETLHIALEIDPGVLDVREKLFQVLVDSGDIEGAAHESVNVATVHLNLDDRDSAIQVLHNGLRLLPGNEPALQLLAEIGAPPPPGWGVAEPPRATATRRGVPDSVGKYSSAALPSYDLEEVSAADVVGTMSFDGVDDPFADLGDMPLPSFPLGEGDSGLGEHPAGAQKRAAPGVSADPGYASEAPTRGAPVGYGMPATSGAPVLGAEEEIYEVEPEYPADSDQAFASDAYAAEFASSQANYDAYRASLRPDGEGSAEGIEEVLEEAEFFAARGLFEDAKNILVDQLTRTPNHPLVLERLAEVEGALGHTSGSGTIDRSQLEPARKSDRVFDIAASLEALDALDARQTAGRQQFASQHDEVDVEQVFAKFKEGVKKQVADTDSATHYDLGVAYKEMGLLPDAVNEFELAAQDPMRECMCLAMIGMIHLEQNKLELAEAAYKRGLEARMKTVDQEMSLYYDLGNVMEMKQLPDEALYYFRRIARRDPGFRDVKDRLAALEPKQEPSSRARSGRDEEDFDRAFDELFDNPGAKAAVGKPRR